MWVVSICSFISLHKGEDMLSKMSNYPFKVAQTIRQGELFILVACKEFQTETGSVAFHWPDWPVTLYTTCLLFSNEVSVSHFPPRLHGAHSLCSLKSLTHTNASPITCISNDEPFASCVDPPSQCQGDVSDLDEIWMEEEVGMFGIRSVIKTVQSSSRCWFCFLLLLGKWQQSNIQRPGCISISDLFSKIKQDNNTDMFCGRRVWVCRYTLCVSHAPFS